MEMSLTVILSIIALILLIVEIFTTSTILVFIACGFLTASVVSMYSESYLLMIFCGTIVTIITIVFFRSKLKNKYLAGETHKTSYEELIGKKAVIVKGFKANGVDTGIVRINGVEWQAIAEDNLEYLDQDYVTILKIVGTKIYVSKGE